jgi:hypothetical protein
MNIKFADEKAILLHEMEILRQERSESQLAFDRYRERAKLSLKKTAAEQQTLEQQVADAQEAVKLEKLKCGKLESELRALHGEQEAFRQSVLLSVDNEKQEIARIREDVILLRSNLVAAVDSENSRIAALEAAALQAKGNVEEEKQVLEAECERLKQREKQLLAEMKKKGDLARQMLVAKDEELNALRSGQHHVAQSYHSSNVGSPTAASNANGSGNTGPGASTPRLGTHQAAASFTFSGTAERSPSSTASVPAGNSPTHASTSNVDASVTGSGGKSGKGQAIEATPPRHMRHEVCLLLMK